MNHKLLERTAANPFEFNPTTYTMLVTLFFALLVARTTFSAVSMSADVNQDCIIITASFVYQSTGSRARLRVYFELFHKIRLYTCTAFLPPFFLRLYLRLNLIQTIA